MRRLDRFWVFLCAAILAYVCWRPIGNPDLFWHLTLGREFLSSGRLPRADFLSYTRSGVAWINHEWLSQVLYVRIMNVGGLAALIALKTLLFGAAAACLERVLSCEGSSAPVRGAAVLLFAAGTLLHNDVRPENFSVLLFAVQILALERLRRDTDRSAAAAGVAGLVGFMLWANLHAGFIMGLALESCYLADAVLRGDRPRGRRYASLLAGSAIGTLANPFGWKVYRFLWEHGRYSVQLMEHNVEWHPTFLSDPYNGPFWCLLALTLAAAAVPRLRRRLEAQHWLALSGLAVAAMRHRRVIPFFILASLAYVPRAFQGGAETVRRKVLPAFSTGLLALTLFDLHAYRPWPDSFTPVQSALFPERSADFLDREAAALSPLRLYHPLAWGGYLGYRLYPRYRVFTHSMFLMFLDIVLDEMASTDRPEHWQSFLDRRGLSLVLLERNMPDIPQKRVGPDGAVEYEPRPYYLFFMPQDRWNLVFWDSASMIFVRAGALPRDWTDRHAYRWLHPGDAAAVRRALSAGKWPKESVRAEICRHEAESGIDPESDYLLSVMGAEACAVAGN